MELSHEHFMREALKEAKYALEADEVPIGAVVVCNNKIIGRGHNQVELLNDVTAHAEMIALTAAANYLGGKYIIDCTLYVTLEPCSMCASALGWSQVSKIVYGASDPKKGYTGISSKLIHPKTNVVSGIMEAECSSLLKDFFKKLREG
jgi:tRNA(adenine34) deaminase